MGEPLAVELAQGTGQTKSGRSPISSCALAPSCSFLDQEGNLRRPLMAQSGHRPPANGTMNVDNQRGAWALPHACYMR